MTTKDKIALSSAILSGAVFGCLSFLAGYGWLVVAVFYGIFIIPPLLIFIAEHGKIFVWQLSVLSFALSTALSLVVADAFASGSVKGDGITVFFLFWAVESVISSPVPIFLYWRCSKKRKWYRFEWLFLGLIFSGLIGILWRNAFLFVCLALLWCAVCTAIFAWDWRTSAAPAERGEQRYLRWVYSSWRCWDQPRLESPRSNKCFGQQWTITITASLARW